MKTKFIIGFIILVHFFYKESVLASAWLPETGKYKYTTSLMLSDSDVREAQKREAQEYLKREKRIYKLYQQQKRFLPPSARYKQINQSIEVLKKSLSFINDSFRDTEVLISSVEYGAKPILSFGLSVMGKQRLFHHKIGGRGENFWQSADVFIKYKIKQHKNYIFSIQPLIRVEGDNRFGGELSFLYGYSGKFKQFPRFTQMGISAGNYFSKKNQTKPQFSFSMNEGVTLPHAITLGCYAKYSIGDRRNLTYSHSIYEQFSIAKEFKLAILRGGKVTAQVGYFEDRSLKYSSIKNTGFVFTAWMEI